MKILYLLETFPEISETFIVNEIIELKRLGHEIKILAYHQRNADDPDKIHENIIKYKLLKDAYYADPNKTLNRPYFLKTLLFDLIKEPVRTLKFLFHIYKTYPTYKFIPINYFSAKKASKFDFDLIHSGFSYLGHLSQAFYLSKIFRKPFIITCRASDIYIKNTKKELKNKTSLIKKASKIITISKYNVINLRRKFNLKDNIELVHSAIDINKFRQAKTKENKRILSICRFVEKKGIECLIKALYIIKKNKINFNFVLIGGGPLKDKYEKLIKKYNLEENITIKQVLTQEEVKKELRESMIFVLPCVVAKNGDRDILPNVLKEAMAMEIPIITSDISGIKELVEDGETGILVPPKNPKAIANAISKLYKNRISRNRMGKQGREKIEKDFNIKIEAKRIEKISKEVIKSNKSYLF